MSWDKSPNSLGDRSWPWSWEKIFIIAQAVCTVSYTNQYLFSSIQQIQGPIIKDRRFSALVPQSGAESGIGHHLIWDRFQITQAQV